jgi:hypothetical protein
MCADAYRSNQGSQSGSVVASVGADSSDGAVRIFGSIAGGLAAGSLRKRWGTNRLVFRVIRPSSSRMPMPQAWPLTIQLPTTGYRPSQLGRGWNCW